MSKNKVLIEANLACNFGCRYYSLNCWIYSLLYIPYGPVVG
ncbi:hypothetical protein RchiOBHm_Chr5g0031871 [Rosa chinensis]|uniref:Uncharacterized protein n=1 Tax=Rosa chinensis TaxID=74649 RepID=A0A2P6PNJ8_ROSCH|nr:hypothetical protein RchiOBHm_Chr6g0262111 [Rosa chinensis]PRQ31108.1 hypothetical protein RchiOBHm_Chr5g0031871 [Rosa chinensis]